MRSAMQQILACVERWSSRSLALVLSICFAEAQITPPSFDTTLRQPSLMVGMTRIGFTSVFLGDATLEQAALGGILSLRQQYRGTSLLTGIRSFRDDELFRLQWRYPVAPSLMLVQRAEWDVSNDSRALGIARMERFRVASGVGHTSLVGRVEAYAGGEQAEQLGIRERGLALGVRLISNTLTIGDVSLDIISDAEQVHLQRRKNADLSARFILSTPESNVLHLATEYRRQRRDYYTTLGITQSIALEHRTEDRWTLDGTLRQEIGPVQLTLAPQFSLLTVERSFDAPTPLSGLTYVRRALQQFDGGVRVELHLTTVRSLHQVGLDVRQRDERNRTYDVFTPPMPQLVEDVRQSESMRDNQSTRLQLWMNHATVLSASDSLELRAQSTMVRYDTPSLLNYDDRDELSHGVQMRYRRRWSTAFTTNVTTEYSAVHFVFLAAQRSALSNWNRTLRTSTQCVYALGDLSWNPSFELIAQYTTYDFEGLSGVPQSFSFRQIAYRDSVRASLRPFMLHAQVFIRWFVRGDFSWAQFAERPTGTGREFFARVMLWRTLADELECGFGGRWYELFQQLRLTSLAGLSSQQQSVAPEAEIRFITSVLELRLNGWFELRRVVGNELQQIPNLQLSVVRSL
jgi:hypothetical protein